MAIIAPFNGVMYNLNKITNIHKVVSPPYDVISNSDQKYYYDKDPYNAIRLSFGKKKTGDSDWDNRYTRAADLFKKWLSEQTLIRAQYPSIYLISTEYKSPHNSEKKTRWAFISLVRIEEDGSKIILPHEKTFSFHRQDRLRLMRTCNAQFSPIFSIYEDKENTVFYNFEGVKHTPSTISFKDDNGYDYNIWEIKDNSIIGKIASEMTPKSIIIADGHHRYEAARSYRNMLRARYGLHHPERSYEYVMMYLTNIDDEGLTILPTHRLIKSHSGFNITKFLASAGKWFDIIPLSFSPANSEGVKETFFKQLKEHGKNTTAIGFYYYTSKKYYILCLKPGARKNLGTDLHPSLKKLDVLALSRFILQKTLDIKRDELDNEKIIQYMSDANRSLSLVSSGEYQMVFLMNHTKIKQIIEVTGNSLLMPRKSTYFYPKIVTGLVFNAIDPKEVIQVPGH